MTAAGEVQLAPHGSTFIDGTWRPPAGGRVHQIVDPSTEHVVHTGAESSLSDVAAAVGAARTAFDDGPWRRFDPLRRAEVLDALADALAGRAVEIAFAATSEMGVPTRMAGGSVQRGIDYLRYYAGLARNHPFDEERRRSDGGPTRVLREAVGAVAAIVPFNAPFTVACMKIAPALAAGATVVVKPPVETPLAVSVLADVLQGLTADGVLPPGVVNVVVADVAGSAALVGDPRIDKVTFTGSTAVGRAISAAVADRIGRTTLELGGKSAAIVLDDADTARLAGALVRGGTGNTGQACFGLTRVLVPARRRDEVVDLLREELGGLVVGDAHDPRTTTGPLSAARHRDRVEDFVRGAVTDGARVAVGGGRPAHLERGYFVEPTVLVDVEPTMRVAREEVFGPVISVLGYESVDAAVAVANDSIYGLGGAVFGQDLDECVDVARQLRTGTVAVNDFLGADVATPFGGYKQSGVGREGGTEGLEAFLEVKSVHLPR